MEGSTELPKRSHYLKKTRWNPILRHRKKKGKRLSGLTRSKVEYLLFSIYILVDTQHSLSTWEHVAMKHGGGSILVVGVMLSETVSRWFTLQQGNDSDHTAKATSYWIKNLNICMNDPVKVQTSANCCSFLSNLTAHE